MTSLLWSGIRTVVDIRGAPHVHLCSDLLKLHIRTDALAEDYDVAFNSECCLLL